MLKSKLKGFERGKDTEDIVYKSKDTEEYLLLKFDVYEGVRDVYVYEIVEVTLPEEVEIDGEYYEKGYKIYMEKEYETPTVYGHDLAYEELIAHIENNFEEVKVRPSTWVSKYESSWEKLEKYL